MPSKYTHAQNLHQKPRSGGKVRAAAGKAAILTAVAALSLSACAVATPANSGSVAGADLAAAISPVSTTSPVKATAPASKAPAAKAPAAKTAPAKASPAKAPGQTPSPTAAAPSTKTPPSAAPAAAKPAAATSSDGIQAAVSRSWGQVVAGDEFSYTGAPDRAKWSVYNGAGHAGKGSRTRSAWNVANGMATVNGDSAGVTGGMSAKFAEQQYGRWETRMRTNTRDAQYHPVLILWPTGSSSKCAEIDYAEGTSETALMKFFLHYKCGGSDFQTTKSTSVDTTQWHNYAVEWTPSAITGYIDGVMTFQDTNPAHQPGVAMHQTMQLDWFPSGSAAPKPSQMQVDWVRVYK